METLTLQIIEDEDFMCVDTLSPSLLSSMPLDKAYHSLESLKKKRITKHISFNVGMHVPINAHKVL